MSNPALNLKVHSAANIVLAIFCFVFQIASIATSPKNVYEAIGIGFWGGIILAVTAVSAYKASQENNLFILGFTLSMAIMSFFISFSILGIFSASIDYMNKYPENCTVVNSPPPIGEMVPLYCGDYSVTREAFDALLLICGLVGIFVNGLLVLTSIQLYSPPPAPTA